MRKIVKHSIERMLRILNIREEDISPQSREPYRFVTKTGKPFKTIRPLVEIIRQMYAKKIRDFAFEIYELLKDEGYEQEFILSTLVEVIRYDMLIEKYLTGKDPFEEIRSSFYLDKK